MQSCIGRFRLIRSFACYERRTILIRVKRSFGNESVVKLSNAPSSSWIDTYAPPSIRPYLHLARADKQIGTHLLFWPCSWGVALATPLGSLPDVMLISKFAVGAIIMRAAGCIINDIMDRDIDKLVDRTKSRPLASGALNVKQALGFLSIHLLGGLGVLMSFNISTIGTAFLSVPLIIIYPLMKRFTNWPQLVLGLAFNWGTIVGWTAVTGIISYPHIIPLYASGICWTLIYDTIYAYQDKEDDLKIGVKSTTMALGDKPQIALTLISTGMALGLTSAGLMTDLTVPYYVGITAVMSHIQWQIWSADITNRSNLWERFSSNRYVGAAIFASIVAGHF